MQRVLSCRHLPEALVQKVLGFACPKEYKRLVTSGSENGVSREFYYFLMNSIRVLHWSSKDAFLDLSHWLKRRKEYHGFSSPIETLKCEYFC